MGGGSSSTNIALFSYSNDARALRMWRTAASSRNRFSASPGHPDRIANFGQPMAATDPQGDGAAPDLYLNFHGRIIEHLGLQMYQSPTAALAELLSNAWDADSEKVAITLPSDMTSGAKIVIQDWGNGMTLEEVRGQYLKVGQNRRGSNPSQRSPLLNRAILGRKGIGKFAGFGIARRITVDTISRDTGEKTTFTLEYERIRGESDEYVNEAPLFIPGAAYEAADTTRIPNHGTTITLSDLIISRRPPAEQMRKSMSRRFSFGSAISNFEITIDGVPVPADSDSADVQFTFPRDYTAAERPAKLQAIEGEWGTEELPDGNIIQWRYRFYQETINEPELAGVAIFTSGKVAQMPFLFNLAGGLGGQHGAAYMAGRVEADYLDALPRDIISPERQRIDWEAPEASPLLLWGQERTKELLRLWKSRRGEERRRRLEARLAPLDADLAAMPTSERRPLQNLLNNLAKLESISDEQFLTMADSLVAAWKAGRLKGLIEQIGDADALDEAQMLQILLEANILTDLQMAEVVRTKIEIVRELRRRVEQRDVETSLRDYIAQHPFLISPKWNTFKKEARVNTILKDAAANAGIETDPTYAGRVDLAMSSHDTLLVLEFMRPGITLDFDHIQRFQRYIAEIKPGLAANNILELKKVIGYLVADKANQRPAVLQLISDMNKNEQFAVTWPTLLEMAEADWLEQMQILAQRSGEDERIQSIAGAA